MRRRIDYRRKTNNRSIHLKLDDLLEERGLDRNLLIRSSVKRLSTPTSSCKETHKADGFSQKEQRYFYDALRHSFEEDNTTTTTTIQEKSTLVLETPKPQVSTSSKKKTAVVKSAIVHKTMSHFVRPLVTKLANLTARADVSGLGNENHVFRLLAEVRSHVSSSYPKQTTHTHTHTGRRCNKQLRDEKFLKDRFDAVEMRR